MKRIIICFLCCLMLMNSISIVANAYDINEITSPYYIAIRSKGAGLKEAAAGLATCTSSFMTNGSQTIKLTMTLVRVENGSNVHVKSWTASGTGFVSCSQNWYVATGYTYKVIATANIYDSNGTFIESGSVDSNSVFF